VSVGVCHAAVVTGDDDKSIGDRTEVVPYDQATRRPGQAAAKKLGRYTLDRIIAQGGMAEIWLASADGPSGFSKKVVVKRIRPALIKAALRQQEKEGGSANRTVEMFVREARLLARLEHRNIVQVFELGVQPSKREGEPGEHFIVMEYLEGLTLKDLALRSWEQKQPLPIETVVRIVADACLGLDHAHRMKDDRGQPANLVHRDISPDNIFVCGNGTAKLLDFGIAKREDQANLTQAGELKGKVPYMSPEQLKGQRVDARTDLFAIGVVLSWLLAGRRPFDGPSDIYTMKAILDDQPPSLRELNPHVPPMLEDIVHSCLKKEATARISSAAALHDALSMWLLSTPGTHVEVAALVASVRDLDTPGFEVVPVVAAVPSTRWRQAGPSSTVIKAPAVGPVVPVGAPRGRTVVGLDAQGDADTQLQIDPDDVPSTIPPDTLNYAAPLTAADPDPPRAAPPMPLPSPPASSPSPSLPPPPPAVVAGLVGRLDLPPLPPASTPPAPVAASPAAARPAPNPALNPALTDATPSAVRDTVDLPISQLADTGTRPWQLPPTSTSPPLHSSPSSSPYSSAAPPPQNPATPPRSPRSRLGAVAAILIGALLAVVVLAGVAFGLGLWPHREARVVMAVDAGVTPTAVTDAGSAMMVVVDTGASPGGAGVVVTKQAGVEAGSVDAGSVEAGSVDAGSVDAGSVEAGSVEAGGVDAGVDAIVDLPPGDVDGSVERPRRRRPPRIRAPVAVGEGFLVVQARPWAKIAIDSLGIGTTPLPALPLPAGRHRVRLEHNGIVKFQVVEVEAQRTTTIQIDMRE
jgi:serine/threonine-protein kinase